MAELTVRELRKVLEGKIAGAREQVKKWQEYLSLLDDMERESGGDAVVTKVVGATADRSPLVVPKGGVSGKDTGGRMTRQLMLRAEGEFTVPEIVKQIHPQYPSLPHELLTRRGSAIAYRLLKAKKIEVVKSGSGRVPHTYRRVRK